MGVLAGLGSYIYWGLESSWKGGDPSSDEHIPFNQMQGFTPPKCIYTTEKKKTFEALYYNIEYDSKLEAAKATIRTLYRDPFLLLTLFTHKTCTSPWTGTGDIITGDFTDTDDIDSIWIQRHLADQSNTKHLEELFKGGIPVTYRLIFEKGEPVIEEMDVIFTSGEANAQVCNMDTGLDDGAFDVTGAAEVTTIVAVAKANIVDGTYFTIQGISAAYIETDYYVWFDVVGDDSGDPAPAGYTEIRCNISGDTTAQQVSDTITAAIDAVANFGAANGGGTLTTVTVTNANNGHVLDAADVDSNLVIATTTQGKTPQNGGWSAWDGEITEKHLKTESCTPTFNNAPIGGINIESYTLEISLISNTRQLASSLIAGLKWFGGIETYKITVSGPLADNTDFAQYRAVIGSKTTETFKITLGDANKYIQITEMYLEDIEPAGAMPEAGNPSEATYTYVGGAGAAASYSWTGDEANDPNPYITT